MAFATLVPFMGYIAALIPIIVACVIFGSLFTDIMKLLPLLFKVAFELLDPANFLKDLVFGITIGIEMLIRGISNMLFGKMQQQGSKLPGFKNGIFPGGIFGSGKVDEGNAEVKCIKPSAIRLILMVLCPPFAVFMKYGLLRGWLWIIICIILTYNFYYFPGLLFSALHTMCI